MMLQSSSADLSAQVQKKASSTVRTVALPHSLVVLLLLLHSVKVRHKGMISIFFPCMRPMSTEQRGALSIDSDQE